MARIVGSHRPGVHDTLVGTEQSDWIWTGRHGWGDWAYGLGGDDTLLGSRDDDNLDGGDGNDLIRGKDGGDALWGGAGDDRLNGEGGNDDLDGGEGNDTLIGAAGTDTLWGGVGDDVAYGGDDGDYLIGGGGWDYLEGNLGDDNLSLSAGWARGGYGDDLLSAEPLNSNAILTGGPGEDTYLVTLTRGVGLPLAIADIVWDGDDRVSVRVLDQSWTGVGGTMTWDTNGDGRIDDTDPDSIFGAVRSDGVSTLWLWAGDGAETGYSAVVAIHGAASLGADEIFA